MVPKSVNGIALSSNTALEGTIAIYQKNEALYRIRLRISIDEGLALA